MKGAMTVRIVTPESAAAPVECDSVRLCVADGEKQNEAGSYGIRRNHAPAVFSLGDGAVTAFLGGEKVLERRVSGGFASVRNNRVTVVTKE